MVVGVKKGSQKIVSRNDYQIVIGIDQSYKCTGMATVWQQDYGDEFGEDWAYWNVGKYYLMDKKNNGSQTKIEARMMLKEKLEGCISDAVSMKGIQPEDVCVIFERVRLFSNGYIHQSYIEDMSMMVGMITQTCFELGVDCYSVDTRAWKSKVVRTTKSKDNDCFVNPKKYPTVEYIISIGEEDFIREYLPEKTRKKKFLVDNGRKFIYNDNVADAICIAQYGFHKDRKLNNEIK